MKTTISLDGHVHVYPAHDWALAVRSLIGNLPESACKAGLLTETASCHFYRQVMDNPAAFRSGSLALEPGPEPGSLAVKEEGAVAGYLIAGRQIATAERLEVLALCADVSIADRLPLRATLDAVRSQNAVPVLPWSPGKWFFRRGCLVENLVRTLAPDGLLLGDTSLRPVFWPLTGLMRLAVQRGFKIVAGTDPLPSIGEERVAGTYGTVVTAEFDSARPVSSVRAFLLDPGVPLVSVGRRSGTVVFFRRWLGVGCQSEKPVSAGHTQPTPNPSKEGKSFGPS